MKVYMFHYVLKDFKYYHFNIEKFEIVIQDLKKQYDIISLRELDNLLKNNSLKSLKKYLLLTFDDGTKDHYYNVYKILKKYNCSGLFFITSSIFDKNVLNIQILHQLLALDKLDEIYDYMINYLKNINFDLVNIRYKKTFDEEKTAMFKQLLQNILPSKIRNDILFKLAKKYNVSLSIEDYYINTEQMKEMKLNNMFFGIHTKTHPDLSLLSYSEQHEEIYGNYKDLIENELIEKDLLSISYPYGSYNEVTLKVVKKLNIKYGFNAFENNSDSLLEIDRIDCKYLKGDINE